MNATQARSLAAALLGREVVAAEPVGGGGNNRIFAIDTGTGRLALKSYPPQTGDRRDRLGQEWQALTFLAAHGLKVPNPVAVDPARHAALYAWIDGHPAAAAAPETLVSFFTALQALRAAPEAQSLPQASTPIFTAAEAQRQLADRLRAFDGVALLADHLDRVRAVAAQAFGRARSLLGDGFDQAPPAWTRVLSQSDFGRHNLLETPTGTVFVDFEYFGWDGPEKAIADAVLHPGSNFSEAERDRLQGLMLAALPEDRGLALRLRAIFPLIALIWCLILLNEFHPDGRARRGLVAGSPEARAAEIRQLEKSRTLLSWLEEAHDLAPA
jgi:hypothetical protein